MKKDLATKRSPAAITPKAATDLPVRPAAPIAPFLGFTPFNAMRRFTDEFERMFDEFNNFNFALNPLFAPTLAFPTFPEFEEPIWAPRIEVFEKKGMFMVRADLPGMKKDDINVEFFKNALQISGERNIEQEEEREGFYRTEREYGTFFRNIPLPEGIDTENATATFDNGVLEIAMKMPAHTKKGRKLDITAKHEPLKAKAAAK